MFRWWWDPFEELRRMQERMSRIFNELEPVFGERLALPGERGWLRPYEPYTLEPFADVRETDKEVIVTVDLPGVDKKDINIEVQGDVLEISAEKKVEAEEERKGYIKRERAYSRFYKSVRLPTEVDETKAEATLNNGVLEIRLPKIKAVKARTIPVK
jgi:HSP20 family protein